jgi:hypothetical protein
MVQNGIWGVCRGSLYCLLNSILRKVLNKFIEAVEKHKVEIVFEEDIS